MATPASKTQSPQAHPLQATDFYHTGIVVPDLEAWKDRLSALAGYRWTTTLTNRLAVRLADGDRILQMRYAYSLDAPHLELVQAIPDTLWAASAHAATHHLGYLCDDLAGTAGRLEEAGFVREACAVVDGSAPSIFAFYLSPDGVRIEIVDRDRIPDWDAYLRERTPR